MVLILGSDSIYWILFVSLHAEDFFSLFTNAAIFVKGNHDEAYEPSKATANKKTRRVTAVHAVRFWIVPFVEMKTSWWEIRWWDKKNDKTNMTVIMEMKWFVLF